jgi:hypothetical protein
MPVALLICYAQSRIQAPYITLIVPPPSQSQALWLSPRKETYFTNHPELWITAGR